MRLEDVRVNEQIIIEDREVQFDSYLQEDIETISKCINSFKELHNKTVFVTGTTGLIGQQVVKAFLCANRLFGTNINIIAHARNEEKVNQIYGNLINRNNIQFIYSDITKPFDEDIKCDYIIHGAGITGNPKRHIDNPTITINTAVLGTHNVLELAKQNRVKGMVYMSSWEVYGITDQNKEEIYENDYGYIDLSVVRRCHGESKRLCECYCVAYANEFDLPIMMGRIPLTFGPGVMDTDNRVFAQFARSVVKNEDIILHTTGETLRNHCYIADVIRALLYIMVKGNKAESYNIVNENTGMSIIDMAKLVSDLYDDRKINVKVEIEDSSKFGYNPVLRCLLNSKKLQELGWKPMYDLEDMYDRMIRSMYIEEKARGNNQ